MRPRATAAPMPSRFLPMPICRKSHPPADTALGTTTRAGRSALRPIMPRQAVAAFPVNSLSASVLRFVGSPYIHYDIGDITSVNSLIHNAKNALHRECFNVIIIIDERRYVTYNLKAMGDRSRGRSCVWRDLGLGN